VTCKALMSVTHNFLFRNRCKKGVGGVEKVRGAIFLTDVYAGCGLLIFVS